jgi:hypothetical protein
MDQQDSSYDDDQHFDQVQIRTKDRIFREQQKNLALLRHSEASDAMIKKYPKIFRDIGGDPKDTCMAFGISCGIGWFQIIDTLCNCIQKHCDHKNTVYNVDTNESYIMPDSDPSHMQVVALQVKQKLHVLCFYTSGGDETVHGMIEIAEALSAYISEDDGFPIQIRR